jgi:hypothetical protein
MISVATELQQIIILIVQGKKTNKSQMIIDTEQFSHFSGL